MRKHLPIFALALFVALTAALTGCLREEQTTDVGVLAQAAYNAAASLPSAYRQRTAIMSAMVQIGATVGHPIDFKQGDVAP